MDRRASAAPSGAAPNWSSAGRGGRVLRPCTAPSRRQGRPRPVRSGMSTSPSRCHPPITCAPSRPPAARRVWTARGSSSQAAAAWGVRKDSRNSATWPSSLAGRSRQPADDRRRVDAGLRQIGQSGRFVAPDIYVAVAISGTPQHLAGISARSRIVAINHDPEADIFRHATVGIGRRLEAVAAGSPGAAAWNGRLYQPALMLTLSRGWPGRSLPLTVNIKAGFRAFCLSEHLYPSDDSVRTDDALSWRNADRESSATGHMPLRRSDRKATNSFTRGGTKREGG